MAVGADTARTMKRRGILAAAGAAIAGIAAKQAAQPVSAGTDGDVVLGAGNSTTTETIVRNTNATAGNATFQAIRSTTVLSAGLNLSHGIYALSDFSGGVGVEGIGGTSGIGVSGFAATGVLGESATGAGVEGQIRSTSNAANTIGVFGNNLSSGANGIGVYGSCANGTGIYGQTSASFQYGVLGTTYAPTSTAIAGTCTGNGSSAFSGGTGNANAFAAYFQGHVQVDGPFDVIGAGNKHAAVPHPDGSHRTIYSIEAAEAWIEDFGTGTLAGGKADVKLDADFAVLIHTEDYHVFVTEHNDHHLHVSQRTGGGFIVEADTALAALKGKKASDLAGTFSWRVVAKPKTSAKVGRLAKVNLADAKALLPDPAKLPKPPETPKAIVPTKP